MAHALASLAKRSSGRGIDWGQITGAILAGGLGTRLRPVIADRPKVLAAVAGRPFVTHLLEQMARAGIRRTVLLTGNGADQVREELGDRWGEMALEYSAEPHPLGTAGALRLALAKIATPDILLMNGDSYCGANLRELAACHRHSGADLSMVLVRVADAERFGTVQTNPDGTIVRFAEKGSCGPGWVNAGIYMLKRELVHEIPEGRPVSLEREVIPAALSRKRLVGVKSRAPLLDIGTPESYVAAAALFGKL